MFALILASVPAALSLTVLVLLLGCAAVAIIGTRIVRSKQKSQVRQWRLERKCREKHNKD